MWLYLIDLMFFLIETGGAGRWGKAISLRDVPRKTEELGLGSGFKFNHSTHFVACVKPYPAFCACSGLCF